MVFTGQDQTLLLPSISLFVTKKSSVIFLEKYKYYNNKLGENKTDTTPERSPCLSFF